ncbi:MAG TPA: hypothetical protein PLH57_03505 [Oligoflexia bacterium]|nr:hypothetical protein [Oligoflexia bacterium]
MTRILRLVPLLFLGILTSEIAGAVSLEPVGHATDEEVGSTRYIYFPVIGAAADNCNNSRTYPSSLTPIDPTTGEVLFYVTATSSLSEIYTGSTGTTVNSGDLSIRVELVSSNTPVALNDQGAGYNDGVTGHEVNYGNTENARKLIGLSLPDNGAGSYGLCGLPAIWGATTNCRPGLAANQPSITLRIGVIREGQAFSDTDDEDAEDVTIRLVDCPPHASGALIEPTLDFDLRPGDERLTITNRTSAPSDPFGISQVVAYGTKSSTTVTLSNSLPAGGGFQRAIGTSASAISIDGLENDTQYCVSLGYVNKGGLVATDSTWSANLPDNLDSSRACVTPSRIDGFLQKNGCFIATAAFGDEWHPRVNTLREFRDRILLKTALGTSFVNWYYSWSPKKAEWLKSRPWARAAVRTALLPLVTGASAVLWLKEHLTYTWQRLKKLEFGVKSAKAETIQPYIDSIKKKYNLPDPETESIAEVAEPIAVPQATPYPTGNTEAVQPYIDELQSKARAEESSKSASTPSSQGVQPYIESVKKGKELEPKYRGSVNRAAGLSILTSSDFDVDSNSIQANQFNSVYETKSKYVPGVDLYYEHQLLRDRTFGALGLVSHLKVFVARGRGIFTRRQVRSDDTKFRFTAFPVSLGVGYRFLLARFIVPYVHVSGVMTPMIESRDDQKPTRKALSRGTSVIVGGSLNLDWITRKDAWSRYDAYDVLHTYLTLQWEKARSFSGAVDFNYDAVYAGLGFEF